MFARISMIVDNIVRHWRAYTLPAGLMLLVLCSLGCNPAAMAQPARPNVLMITVDDLRAELGQYGNPIIKTPNIDALAKLGVKFNRAYSQYPLCNPSRASFLTGRYPASTGIFWNDKSFRQVHPELVTLPQHLRQNGYVTINVGKIFHFPDPISWTESYSPSGNPVPGDPRTSAWFPVEGAAAGTLLDTMLTDKAIELLERPRSSPLFLAVGYHRPHTRWVCPKTYFDLYRPADMVLPSNFAPRPTVPLGVPAAAVHPTNADLFRDVDVTPDMARTAIAAYFACISYIDAQVGRLMAALDRAGAPDRRRSRHRGPGPELAPCRFARRPVPDARPTRGSASARRASGRQPSPASAGP